MTAARSLPRILVVTPRTPAAIGGVERHVRETTRRLAARGVSVSVLCAHPGATRVSDDELDGVPIRAVPAYPAGSDLMIAPRLWPEIAAARPDLIHVQSYHTLVAPLALGRARSLGVPYVLTFHGGGSSVSWRNRVRTLQRRSQRRLYADAARLIAIAAFERELYSRELDLPRERFSLIPNGTDPPPGDCTPAPSAPVPAREPVTIASIGRLEAYKGHQRAIAVLVALLEHRPGSRLLIVGEGPYESRLREAAAAAGVAGHVDFRSIAPGDARGMSGLLASVDLVLLLSEFETHPLVALEAAAMRRRLVVADVGGLAELAARGYAQPVALELPAELIASVLERELRRPGPTEAPPAYDWDACAGDLLALYLEILGRC